MGLQMNTFKISVYHSGTRGYCWNKAGTQISNQLQAAMASCSQQVTEGWNHTPFSEDRYLVHPFEHTALLAAREDRPLVHICLRTGSGRSNALKKSPPCSRKSFAFHFYKLWTRAENKLQKSSGKWQVLAVPGSGGHWPKEMGCHQKKFKVLFRNHAHFYSMLREALDREVR